MEAGHYLNAHLYVLLLPCWVFITLENDWPSLIP